MTYKNFCEHLEYFEKLFVSVNVWGIDLIAVNPSKIRDEDIEEHFNSMIIVLKIAPKILIEKPLNNRFFNFLISESQKKSFTDVWTAISFFDNFFLKCNDKLINVDRNIGLSIASNYNYNKNSDILKGIYSWSNFLADINQLRILAYDYFNKYSIKIEIIEENFASNFGDPKIIKEELENIDSQFFREKYDKVAIGLTQIYEHDLIPLISKDRNKKKIIENLSEKISFLKVDEVGDAVNTLLSLVSGVRNGLKSKTTVDSASKLTKVISEKMETSTNEEKKVFVGLYIDFVKLIFNLLIRMDNFKKS